ncbi:MAG: hypothetical protein JWM95_2737 [Gemmatimonadetes bacterium]|nr:hypothetical protein [Gemmatimonadota bacterium]
MKLYDDTFFTHMPFAFEDRLLHCKGRTRTVPKADVNDSTLWEYQAYDLYYSDLDGANSQYIGAGLGDDVIACSPNAYRDADGIIVLNYVAASVTCAYHRYVHYQRKGSSLSTLGPPRMIPEPLGIPNLCQSEDGSFSYTVSPVIGEQSHLVQYEKASGRHRKWKLGNLSALKRAVVMDEHSLVITYLDTVGEAASALFDTDACTLMNIKVCGKHVYKSHLFDGSVFHSVRSASPYGMAIHRSSFDLAPSSLTTTVSSWS